MPTIPQRQTATPYEGYARDQMLVDQRNSPYAQFLSSYGPTQGQYDFAGAGGRIRDYERDARAIDRTEAPRNPAEALRYE